MSLILKMPHCHGLTKDPSNASVTSTEVSFLAISHLLRSSRFTLYASKREILWRCMVVPFLLVYLFGYIQHQSMIADVLFQAQNVKMESDLVTEPDPHMICFQYHNLYYRLRTFHLRKSIRHDSQLPYRVQDNPFEQESQT